MLVSLVLLEDLDLLDHRDLKVQLALLVVLEKRVLRELLVVLDLKVSLVNLALQELQVPWELLVLVVMRENRDQLARLALRVLKEIKESQACQDCVEQEENLDPKEMVVLKVLLDPVVLLVQWAHKDNKDPRVCPEPEAILDLRVPQESLEMLDHKVVKETRDHLDLLEPLVLKDLKEAWV